MLPNVKKFDSVHKLRLSRHISVAEATGYKVIVASLQVKGYCRPGGTICLSRSISITLRLH